MRHKDVYPINTSSLRWRKVHVTKLWQFKELAPLPPISASPLPWDRAEALKVLPPRNEARYAARGQYQATDTEERKEAPRVLVDRVAAVMAISKGKARKAIATGQVRVKASEAEPRTVYDPDYVLADAEHVVADE